MSDKGYWDPPVLHVPCHLPVCPAWGQLWAVQMAGGGPEGIPPLAVYQQVHACICPPAPLLPCGWGTVMAMTQCSLQADLWASWGRAWGRASDQTRTTLLASTLSFPSLVCLRLLRLLKRLTISVGQNMQTYHSIAHYNWSWVSCL